MSTSNFPNESFTIFCSKVTLLSLIYEQQKFKIKQKGKQSRMLQVREVQRISSISSISSISNISKSVASTHQRISSISASAASALQQHKCISTSAATAHQQQQCITTCDASASSLHQVKVQKQNLKKNLTNVSLYVCMSAKNSKMLVFFMFLCFCMFFSNCRLRKNIKCQFLWSMYVCKAKTNICQFFMFFCTFPLFIKYFYMPN